MEKKSNFRRAYTELASMVGVDSTTEAEATTPVAPADGSVDDVMQDILNTVAEVAPAKVAPIYATPASITTIAADAVLTGDISVGNLEVFGTINGTVTAKGSAMVRGTINGNLQAESIVVDGGSITAETITASGNVEIAKSSNLTGNIVCGSISMHAKLVGDLIVSGNCILHSTAVIEGTLKAASLSVAAGATLKGLVEITG